MTLTKKGIIITGVIWLGTVAGAYYYAGHQMASANSGGDGKTASGSVISSRNGGPGKSGGKGARDGPDKDGPEAPLTLKQILAKLKVTMRGGAMQNPVTMMKVMSLLDKVRPEDVQEALAEADAMTDQQQKMMLYMALLGKWAEKDGPAAMKYAEEHSKGLGLMSQVAKMSVATTWAEHDSEAVWKWYQENGAKDGGGMLGGGNLVLTSLFAGMAANDLDLAFKRLDEIDGAAKQMALAGMCQSALFDDEKRAVVLKKLDSLPDDAERKQAKQMMIAQLSMFAPEQAMEWVKTQPPEEQKEMRESMGSMLMMSDPKKGAAMMLEGAAEEAKPKIYSRIVGQWAAMDTNAAGTWLSAQPQGPELDDARSAFVSAASPRDPEAAMVWAATITGPESRISATAEAYNAWQKKDPSAAAQALTAGTLSPEDQESVRKQAAALAAGAGKASPALPVPVPVH